MAGRSTGVLALIRGQAGFLTSAGWLFVTAVLTRGASLLATIAVSRLLAPASFGRLAVVQTTVAVLSGLAGLGLGVAVTKHIAESRDAPVRAGRSLCAGLTATLLVGVLVAGAMTALARPLAEALLRSSGAADAIVASSGAVLCAAVLATVQGGFAGVEHFRKLAFSQGLQSVLPAIGLVIGAVTSGLVGALAGSSVGTAVALAGSLLMLRNSCRTERIPIIQRFDLGVFRAMFKLGGSAFASFIAVTAALLLGQLLLAYRHNGYAQVAVFNVAYRWHVALLLGSSSLAAVLLPTLTRLGADGRSRQSFELFRFNTWSALLVTAVPAAVFALAAQWVLGLSGAYYAHHWVPFVVMMAATVPSALNNVLSSTCIGLGAILAWLISDLALAAAFFLVAAVTIPLVGASGLALAYLVGFLATVAVLVAPIRNRLSTRTLFTSTGDACDARNYA